MLDENDKDYDPKFLLSSFFNPQMVYFIKKDTNINIEEIGRQLLAIVRV